MKLEFFVAGTPAPGGSKNGFPFRRADGSLGVRMVDAGKGNAEWKKVVAWHAKVAMRGKTVLSGPLRLSCEFIMPRGKTVTRKHHTVPPDATKLLRACEDAMTEIVWVDDAQIVEQGNVRKRYARPGEPTGAKIVIETIEDEAEQELALVAAWTPPLNPQPDLSDSPFS